jgi:hypothetical protein
VSEALANAAGTFSAASSAVATSVAVFAALALPRHRYGQEIAAAWIGKEKLRTFSLPGSWNAGSREGPTGGRMLAAMHDAAAVATL